MGYPYKKVALEKRALTPSPSPNWRGELSEYLSPLHSWRGFG